MEINNSFFEEFDNLNLGTPEAGKVLLSDPFLNDTNFKRSVIYITEHSKKEGTVGFVLTNRVPNIKIHEAIEEFPAFDAPLYFGGPVETDKLYYLHTLGNLIEGSVLIKDNLYWGGDFNQLKVLIDSQQIKPTEIRFFAGYSGWSPMQLEAEMERRSWYVSEISIAEVLQTSDNESWEKTLKKMGKSYEKITNFPVDPSLN